MFGDIAEYYYKLLLSGSKENILKVLKFTVAPLRNVRQHTKVMGEEKLFHMCMEDFFETGKTPIDDSPKALPDIKPSPHLIGSALLSFSKLYEKFRYTSVNWILSAFFIAQLFREITDSDNLSIEHLVTNMLEELLFNCSTRELKTNRKEQNIQFHDAEYFTRTFIRILTQEQLSNKEESSSRTKLSSQENDERSRYRKHIQGLFEKDPRAWNSLIGQVKNIRDSIKAHNVSVNQESGYMYNGLSSDI